MNRVKFGADSVMYFPFIFGGVKAVGKVATYGKELALSSSKINKSIDKLLLQLDLHLINQQLCF